MAAASPPSPQEVHRKLSIHAARSPKGAPSGTQPLAIPQPPHDADAAVPPLDALSLSGPAHPYAHAHAHAAAAAALPAGASASSSAPLSSIAERRAGSGGDESEDDEDDGADEDEDAAGGWAAAPWAGDAKTQNRRSADESVIKAGYLWKKGERRKTWKKRWFILRAAHLAYYKTSAEYELLRLLDLGDVHSATPCQLKNHAHTFGLVLPARTFYLQAPAAQDVHEWVAAILGARAALLAGTPVEAPAPPLAPGGTSSDSEDGGGLSVSPQAPSALARAAGKDGAARTVVAGYLMKCGAKRRTWRKRWFVLSEEKLWYSASHMDTKPHRQFLVSEILDALEYDLPAAHAHRATPSLIAPAPPHAAPAPAHAHLHHAHVPHLHAHPPADAADAAAAAAGDAPAPARGAHTFKIVTTRRALLLCAPSEEEEIRWLSAVRALIARRAGSGLVPGDAKAAGGALPPPPPPAGGADGGLKARVRRGSAAGAVPAAGGGAGAGAPGAGSRAAPPEGREGASAH